MKFILTALVVVLLIPFGVHADGDDYITINQPYSSVKSPQLCTNNKGCAQGTCSTVKYTDKTVQMCMGCNLKGAEFCSDGATCNQKSGLCSYQEKQPEDTSDDTTAPRSCRVEFTQQDCGEGYTCQASSGTDRGFCVPQPAGDDRGGGGGASGSEGGAEGSGGGSANSFRDGAAPAGKLLNVFPVDRIDQLVVIFLDAIVDIGVALLILMLVFVGFLFIRAQGNAEEISKARSALIWTAAGGMLILGASAISLALQAAIESL